MERHLQCPVWPKHHSARKIVLGVTRLWAALSPPILPLNKNEKIVLTQTSRPLPCSESYGLCTSLSVRMKTVLWCVRRLWIRCVYVCVCVCMCLCVYVYVDCEDSVCVCVCVCVCTQIEKTVVWCVYVD